MAQVLKLGSRMSCADFHSGSSVSAVNSPALLWVLRSSRWLTPTSLSKRASSQRSFTISRPETT